MRFAHMADMHLGREQFNQPFRYDDYVRTFREAVEKAVKERVDFILIAGDLFHVSRPSPKALRDAIEILEIPRGKNIPVFAIEGNHDKTIRETSVFDLLEHLGLIHLIGYLREPRESEFQRSERKGSRYLVKGVFGDVEIYGLRHHSRWQLLRGETNVLKALFRGKKGILMLHQAVDYLSKNTPYSDAVDIRLNELPDGFSYYALGHIHVRRLAESSQTGLSGPLAYPGSLERTDVREASHIVSYLEREEKPKVRENCEGIKGFYIVEDLQPEFVEVNSRPFYSVRVGGNSKAELKRKVEEIASLIPSEAIAVITLEGKVKGGISLTEFNDLLKDSRIMYYTFRSRVTSDVVSVEKVTEEELLNGWERELFLHLRTEPKEFSSSLDEFLDWLMDKYRAGTKVREKPREEKRTFKEQKPKTEETKKARKLAGKSPSLNAWLRGG